MGCRGARLESGGPRGGCYSCNRKEVTVAWVGTRMAAVETVGRNGVLP